jgi:3-phosphoshikimate 1-carboxyvinyltransferase
MCSALAYGRSELVQPLSSDDTEAAIRVLSGVGIHIKQGTDSWQIDGGMFQAPAGELYCGDSAATLRFMSAICALVPGRCRLTAGPSLSRRPVKPLVEALRRWCVEISASGETAPVEVNGGWFRGGTTEIPGDISSQYISALLLLAPLAQKGGTIWLTTPPESRSYILMTLECLKNFGIRVRRSEELMEFEVERQAYRPTRYRVEGDWSSASYLLGLGAVAGEMKVENLNWRSLQGDKAIVGFLERMGASVTVEGDSVTVKKQPLKAIRADLNDCIDLLPTVAVLAALAEGTSELTGIERARLKESDRINSVKAGLLRAGIRVTEEPDRLTIHGGSRKKL